MICARCVLPESKPDIWLDENGICNICKEAKKRDEVKKGKGTTKLLETDLIKMLNKYRGKKQYDCLVMCSGGKDSTASLYYMKERYKLNPLVFTFDLGFETGCAMDNINNAVDILGVDFLYFKTSYMKEMFAKIINSGSKAILCHVCSIWYMKITFDIAAKYDIPIIVAGWTKGQTVEPDVQTRYDDLAMEYVSMSKATKEFLETHVKNDPKYKDFPQDMQLLIKKASKRHKTIQVSPHWFLPATADEYTALIQKELKWQFPKESYPAKSTNCSLNFLSVHLSLKHFGFTHYHVEMSKLIRSGQITRDEALRDLAINFDKKTINYLYLQLGCKPEI
jgi:hypothetical protein